jgi:hypothetical protein
VFVSPNLTVHTVHSMSIQHISSSRRIPSTRFLNVLSRVQLTARRLRPRMHLVRQARCLRAEADSISVEGAIGVRRWLPASLQNSRRVGSIPTTPAGERGKRCRRKAARAESLSTASIPSKGLVRRVGAMPCKHEHQGSTPCGSTERSSLA